jgi:hypothetical protein
MVDGDRTLHRRGLLDHQFTFFFAHGHGLLYENVAAVIESFHGDLAVRRRWSQYMYDIETLTIHLL